MAADVKFNSDRWREMRSGLGHLVGAGWFSEGIGDSLKDVAENFQDIAEDIHRLDSDGVVRFSHTNKSSKYKELQEDFKVLYDFTNKVDEMIEEEIDQPFYEDMDEVAVMMRDLSIHNYTTKNRIGATEIKISSTGAYGANGIQTEEVLKKDITITDLLNGKNPYAEDMKKKYKAFQKANPDAEFTFKEFQKVALQTRAFQYKSIEDEQLKNEMWRDIIIGAGILVVGVFCPPAGIALGVAYGALELGTAVSGKDWGTGRKLDDSERALRGSFALLEIIPGVKAVSSFTKTIRASDILLNAGQITKNSVKLGTNKMIAETAMNLKDTKNLVTSTVKNAETRIKNVQKQLDNLAKISEEKLKQQAFKTADSVDRLVTNMKHINLNPIEDVAFAGVGRLNSSVENTHTIRDMMSKIVKSSEKEINFGDVGTVKNSEITEITGENFGEHIIKGKNGRKELAPNVRYITEENYKYTTDELGRIVDVNAEELMLQKGTRNPGMQVAAGREDRLVDDDGGHLIGTQFRGSGDIDNLLAQNRQINRSGGEWYKMETVWANALKEVPPKKVSVKIEPVYIGDSLRPSYFEIVYKIEGKRLVKKTIKNQLGG